MSTRKEEYIVSLQKLQQDLNKSVQKSLPSREKPYSNVTVIFFRWDVEDFEIEPAESRLKWVFSKVYGFKVVCHRISSNKTSGAAANSVRQAILHNLDNVNGENDLLIIVYNGHATGGSTDCFWK